MFKIPLVFTKVFYQNQSDSEYLNLKFVPTWLMNGFLGIYVGCSRHLHEANTANKLPQYIFYTDKAKVMT